MTSLAIFPVSLHRSQQKGTLEMEWNINSSSTFCLKECWEPVQREMSTTPFHKDVGKIAMVVVGNIQFYINMEIGMCGESGAVIFWLVWKNRMGKQGPIVRKGLYIIGPWDYGALGHYSYKNDVQGNRVLWTDSNHMYAYHNVPMWLHTCRSICELNEYFFYSILSRMGKLIHYVPLDYRIWSSTPHSTQA